MKLVFLCDSVHWSWSPESSLALGIQLFYYLWTSEFVVLVKEEKKGMMEERIERERKKKGGKEDKKKERNKKSQDERKKIREEESDDMFLRFLLNFWMNVFNKLHGNGGGNSLRVIFLGPLISTCSWLGQFLSWTEPSVATMKLLCLLQAEKTFLKRH